MNLTIETDTDDTPDIGFGVAPRTEARNTDGNWEETDE